MKELKYTKTHEWLKADGKTMIVGITEHAQQLLGDLVYVELPEIGKTVKVDEELGVVESVKAASDFYAPVSGTVVAVNEKVSADPSIINQDPYGEGWLIKMHTNNPAELDVLLNEEQYKQSIAEDH